MGDYENYELSDEMKDAVESAVRFAFSMAAGIVPRLFMAVEAQIFLRLSNPELFKETLEGVQRLRKDPHDVTAIKQLLDITRRENEARNVAANAALDQANDLLPAAAMREEYLEYLRLREKYEGYEPPTE